MGQSAFKSYVLDKLHSYRIQNDMGASFTQIARQKNRIIKRADSKGEKKLIDEINWILSFEKTHFGKYLPQIYSHSTEPGNVFYEMKYYSYPNLRKIIIEDMNTTRFLKKRWAILLNILFRDLFRKTNSALPDDNFFEDHHYRKYRERMAAAQGDAPWIGMILSGPFMIINGMQILQPDRIFAEIAARSDIRERLTPRRLYISHGDIHCNNILCGMGPGQMVLLDCRGKSPAGTLYFDPAYDLGKLYHDLHSYYSLIEKGYYRITLSFPGGIPNIEYFFTDSTLTERFNRNYFYVRELINDKYSSDPNLNFRADFTEAVHYLTMIPMHLRIKQEGMLCLATGILRLNQWFKSYYPGDWNRILETECQP
jgi:hypothetical protein